MTREDRPYYEYRIVGPHADTPWTRAGNPAPLKHRVDELNGAYRHLGHDTHKLLRRRIGAVEVVS